MLNRAALICVAIALATVGVHAVPSPPALLFSQVIGSTVILNWSASTPPILGYRLEAGTAPGLSNLANTVIGTATTFTAVSVPPGTYYARIRTIGFDGESEPSNEATIVVGGGGGGCIGSPGAPQLGLPAIAGNAVTLTWLAAIGPCPATNYVVQAGSSPSLSNLAIVNMGTQLSLSAGAPNGTYHVRVVAQNASGVSAPSNEVVFTIGPPPPMLWSVSGSGNTVFDMPRTVSRVLVVGIFSGFCQNFVVRVAGRLLVNEILGTCSSASGPRYEGIHLTTGGVTEVTLSTGVTWSLTQVQ